MFQQDIQHWPTLAAFTAHLAAHPPVESLWGSWVNHDGRRVAWKAGHPTGVTLHHTVIPTVAQWSGKRSVEAMRTFYSAKGWQAGPHLYVVVGSPDPRNDGIWQLTPLNLPGIHAGQWNSRFFGLEVVGNYDAQPWPEPVKDLTLGTLTRMFRWMGWTTATLDTLRGHRECGSSKTCPGKAINMDIVRAWVQTELGWV